MGRKALEKGALQVARLTKPGLHFVGGVDGLALQVVPSGARSWILRMMVGDKRRDMGLGGFPDVTLALARDAARQARAKVKLGIDPIDEARANVSQLKASQAAALTFDQCTAAYIKAKTSEWRNAKHAQQWVNTLTTYASPVMGSLLVRDIGLPHVLAVLEPIWTDKTVTASRVRGRIESVLSWATTREYRSGENPARWRGHLDTVLAAPNRIKNEEHYPTVQVSELGKFMADLRGKSGTGAKALEFGILNASRSGEVRGATWTEIDLSAKLWTIPAARMKAKRAHRVPLSDVSVDLLKALPRFADSNLVFLSPRGKQLSDMTLSQLMRRMDYKSKDGRTAVPHGFRGTFKVWAHERTAFAREIVEMALAHQTENKVEAAYFDTDLMEKRVRLMATWAKFCGTLEMKAEVVAINRTKRITK